jgi:2-amino-4-hydroxy-6-hydroxymethyldihydropteridine diphosphokinase
LNSAVILLGSNLGDCLNNLKQAIELMRKCAAGVSATSDIFETEPWGMQDQPLYYNQVILLETTDNARTLMHLLLEIEQEMGRHRIAKWAPRLIDLDILYFNNEIINEEGLVVPHPRLHERRFTMAPLSQILPDFVHPVMKKSNLDILHSLTDELQVRAIKSVALNK